MVANPIIVAIDTKDRESALQLARATQAAVGAYKIGLGLLHRVGPSLIGELADLGRPVFADAKLHDIPSQVERAAQALGAAGARWVTVHAGGGGDMISAAAAGLAAGSDATSGILAVTVLTSLDDAALSAVGIAEPTGELVAAMAALAGQSGAEGVVCSPHEIAIARAVAPTLAIVTPGIRPETVAAADQRRVATPLAALEAGADWLVVGRAITAAPDPGAAAREIAHSLTSSNH